MHQVEGIQGILFPEGHEYALSVRCPGYQQRISERPLRQNPARCRLAPHCLGSVADGIAWSTGLACFSGLIIPVKEVQDRRGNRMEVALRRLPVKSVFLRSSPARRSTSNAPKRTIRIEFAIPATESPLMAGNILPPSARIKARRGGMNREHFSASPIPTEAKQRQNPPPTGKTQTIEYSSGYRVVRGVPCY
jgi:hypothetical protein